MLRISRNFLLGCAAGAAIALASSPAAAEQRWGWLMTTNEDVEHPDALRHEDLKYYVSAIFKWDWEDFEATKKIGQQFSAYLEKKYGIVWRRNTNAMPQIGYGVASLEQAQQSLESSKRNSPWNAPYVETGWTPGTVPPASTIANKPSVAPQEPVQHKKTNAEADADYARDMAEYNRKMEEYRKSVAEAERLKAEFERERKEARERAAERLRTWKERAAACAAGDYSQCAHTTPQ